MSKKDKERKKKHEGGWLDGDTLPSPSSPSTKRAAEGSRPLDVPSLSDEARDISRHTSPPSPVSHRRDTEREPIPPSRPSEPPMSSRGSGTFDLEAEMAVAPIGPTEHYQSVDSVRPPPPLAFDDGERSPEKLERQIRDLEAKLDQLIKESGPRERPEKEKPAEPQSDDKRGEQEAHVTARDLLASDFYRRQWGKLGMRRRAEEVDDFGLDPAYEARFLPFIDFLVRFYFRVDTRGAHHIPREGRCLVVANHSGGPLPYDGLMLRAIVRREQDGRPDLRWLAEDFIYHLPFVGTAMNRLGAVRACQENAERLLASDRLVAVFPEGAKGIGKLYKERYKLQRFGRGGFIRLALRTGTPIVPCAIVGAEEASPMLARIEYMTKALGIPYLPVTPTFPALGPLGLLPAPTKWKVELGEPIELGDLGPDAADDEILVGRLSERVRAAIQSMLDRAIERRRSIWFG